MGSENGKPTLLELRQRNHTTQMKLAAALGVTLSTVQGIEKGRQLPRVDLAQRIAEFFGVGTDDIRWLVPEPGHRGKVRAAAA